MDLKQLRYFLALTNEGSFSRASEQLHMAQPPLTRQIQSLEEELGTTLFVRTPRGVELTDAGKVMFQEVPNILALVQAAKEKTQYAGQGYLGRLDVGVFGSGILQVIPTLLAQFHSARPEVKLALYTMTKSEQIQALRERRITVGFSRLVPDEPDIAVEVVGRELLYVGLYEDHPLCEKSTITLRDLEDQPIILYPNTPIRSFAQEVISAFRNEGVRLVVAQEVEDVLTCIALVSARFGLCITSASATSLRLPGVAYRPLDSVWLRDIELSVLYRNSDDSPVLRAFLDVMRGSALAAADGKR
ncbi:LysR substrate-binding domain-containing protein [Massilia sp. CMS3.1]|uniref:LysR substrate-binding domain-containing protein n=1 Tax=Massilia sp. CMS3.1 TaxID=3373083 RepID=UPI003EE4EF69